MKKIPTLFKRDFTKPRNPLTREPALTPPEVAVATAKWDGTAILFDGNGGAWARREVGTGKTPPPDFMLADVDSETGKSFGWVPITDDPEWKWHRLAVGDYAGTTFEPVTVEAVGPHFQGNPHHLDEDTIRKHGGAELPLAPTDYDELDGYLAELPYEGIVWWHEGRPIAKIKRRDFNHPWPPR